MRFSALCTSIEFDGTLNLLSRKWDSPRFQVGLLHQVLIASEVASPDTAARLFLWRVIMSSPTTTQATTQAPALSDATAMALDRTRLAFERTTMAWVRTATSLITFGFSFYKFFDIQGHKLEKPGLIDSREFAIAMISIGISLSRVRDASQLAEHANAAHPLSRRIRAAFFRSPPCGSVVGARRRRLDRRPAATLRRSAPQCAQSGRLQCRPMEPALHHDTAAASASSGKHFTTANRGRSERAPSPHPRGRCKRRLRSSPDPRAGRSPPVW